MAIRRYKKRSMRLYLVITIVICLVFTGVGYGFWTSILGAKVQFESGNMDIAFGDTNLFSMELYDENESIRILNTNVYLKDDGKIAEVQANKIQLEELFLKDLIIRLHYKLIPTEESTIKTLANIDSEDNIMGKAFDDKVILKPTNYVARQWLPTLEFDVYEFLDGEKMEGIITFVLTEQSKREFEGLYNNVLYDDLPSNIIAGINTENSSSVQSLEILSAYNFEIPIGVEQNHNNWREIIWSTTFGYWTQGLELKGLIQMARSISVIMPENIEETPLGTEDSSLLNFTSRAEIIQESMDSTELHSSASVSEIEKQSSAETQILDSQKDKTVEATDSTEQEHQSSDELQQVKDVTNENNSSIVSDDNYVKTENTNNTNESISSNSGETSSSSASSETSSSSASSETSCSSSCEVNGRGSGDDGI